MTKDPLKPWSLSPIGTALLALFVLFIGGLGVLTLVATPSLKVTFVTKVFIVLAVPSAIGGAISTFMWSRYWRQVRWETGFWAFVSGPPPEYEEALLAWRWGRRFRLCWIVSMFAIGAIVVPRFLPATGEAVSSQTAGREATWSCSESFLRCQPHSWRAPRIR